jgi:hypothetical protein
VHDLRADKVVDNLLKGVWTQDGYVKKPLGSKLWFDGKEYPVGAVEESVVEGALKQSYSVHLLDIESTEMYTMGGFDSVEAAVKHGQHDDQTTRGGELVISVVASLQRGRPEHRRGRPLEDQRGDDTTGQEQQNREQVDPSRTCPAPPTTSLKFA